jgi:hypothetical protein
VKRVISEVKPLPNSKLPFHPLIQCHRNIALP